MKIKLCENCKWKNVCCYLPEFIDKIERFEELYGFKIKYELEEFCKNHKLNM